MNLKNIFLPFALRAANKQANSRLATLWSVTEFNTSQIITEGY